jgi:hypothetical protein
MANIELAEIQEVFFELKGSNFMEKVEHLENTLINSGSPDIYVGNSDALPLTHSFSDGIYVREIFIQKGMFAIGKIHKTNHSFFILKGKLRFFTETGIKEIEAPYYGNAIAGTKRVSIALEDTVFVNVFPNPNNIKDIDELEDIFLVNSYEDFKNYKLLKEQLWQE